MGEDCGEYGGHLCQDLLVGKMQDAKDPTFQIGHSFPIMLSLRCMGATIDLDDQASWEAREIRDEGSDGLLALEFVFPETTSAKPLP